VEIAAGQSVFHEMASLICDPESSRFGKPFHDGISLYISNHALLLDFGNINPPDDVEINRKSDGKWTVADSDRKPPEKAHVLLESVTCGTREFPLVKGPPVGSDRLWQELQDCEICGGIGSRECDMGHDHDCDDCNGRGSYMQDVDEAKEPVEFMGKHFARRLIWIVSRLPNVKACDEMRGEMLGFTFDGGRGGLMAIKID